MNRNLALMLGMAMSMGMERPPVDPYCEKDGKHCTFLSLGSCRLYDIGLGTDNENHLRCQTCKERNFLIGRTA